MIFWAIQHSFDTKYNINILHTVGPIIVFMSTLIQELFNSGDAKWLPTLKYAMSHVFSQLDTTFKGKLFDQIQSITLKSVLHLSKYLYKVIIVHYIK